MLLVSFTQTWFSFDLMRISVICFSSFLYHLPNSNPYYHDDFFFLDVDHDDLCIPRAKKIIFLKFKYKMH